MKGDYVCMYVGGYVLLPNEILESLNKQPELGTEYSANFGPDVAKKFIECLDSNKPIIVSGKISAPIGDVVVSVSRYGYNTLNTVSRESTGEIIHYVARFIFARGDMEIIGDREGCVMNVAPLDI